MLPVKITANGVEFWASARQAATIEKLCDTNAGGFATVKDYVSTSNRHKPETADVTFISRFSVSRLYKRRKAALEALTLNDIMSDIRDNPKIQATTTEALEQAFNDRKASMIATLDKTLEGSDRTDAHRVAHDRNYVTITDGVKVNFVTEKVDGLQIPVLTGGLPTVASIMLNTICVSKVVKVPGEYKVVNSGVPVIIGNALEKHLPKSATITAVSLKEDNFSALHINGKELLPEEFKPLYENAD